MGLSRELLVAFRSRQLGGHLAELFRFVCGLLILVAIALLSLADRVDPTGALGIMRRVIW